jgi:hypothetical protein
MHAHFLANDRTGDISRQVKENRLAQEIKALEQGKNGRLPAWLSLASLPGLVGFGNGRAAQGPEANRAASLPKVVKPLKPEEQCC